MPAEPTPEQVMAARTTPDCRHVERELRGRFVVTYTCRSKRGHDGEHWARQGDGIVRWESEELETDEVR